MKTKSETHLSKEYRRITSMDDPLAALEECRSAIKRLRQGFRAQRRTYLGILAATSERVCANRGAWREFIFKPFWKEHHPRPWRTDRTNGLKFVILYGENAVTGNGYKRAWRYTVIAEYVLAQGINPDGFAAYFAAPGQSMNATYKKAMKGRKTAQQRDGKPSKDASAKSPPAWENDDEGRANAVKGKANDNALNVSNVSTFKVRGDREVMREIYEVPDEQEAAVAYKWVRDEAGRRWMKPLKLLDRSRMKKLTADRRKGSARPATSPLRASKRRDCKHRHRR